MERSEAQVAPRRMWTQAQLLALGQRVSQESLGLVGVGRGTAGGHLSEKPESLCFDASLPDRPRETERSLSACASIVDAVGEQICFAETQDRSGWGALRLPRLFFCRAVVEGDCLRQTALAALPAESHTRRVLRMAPGTLHSLASDELR